MYVGIANFRCATIARIYDQINLYEHIRDFLHIHIDPVMRNAQVAIPIYIRSIGSCAYTVVMAMMVVGELL